MRVCNLCCDKQVRKRASEYLQMRCSLIPMQFPPLAEKHETRDTTLAEHRRHCLQLCDRKPDPFLTTNRKVKGEGSLDLYNQTQIVWVLSPDLALLDKLTHDFCQFDTLIWILLPQLLNIKEESRWKIPSSHKLQYLMRIFFMLTWGCFVQQFVNMCVWAIWVAPSTTVSGKGVANWGAVHKLMFLINTGSKLAPRQWTDSGSCLFYLWAMRPAIMIGQELLHSGEEDAIGVFQPYIHLAMFKQCTQYVHYRSITRFAQR